MFIRSILTDLKKWADNPSRKPLILRGARQVGKTTIIDYFAGEFDQYIKLNLDKETDRQFFNPNLDINDLIDALFLSYGIRKDNNKTLIFIDEIQNSPEAIRMLRYFYEEANHLFVIAAGSLLETVFAAGLSFPVGRVEYLRMFPCSFNEFLVATENDQAIEVLEKIPFPEYAHTRLSELFQIYTTIGGMPEAVSAYAKNGNVFTLTSIFESLVVSYLDDVEKYAKSKTFEKVVRHTIQQSLAKAGTRITFQGFGDSNYKSREISEAFQMLEKTFLLQLVYPTSNTRIPIEPNYKRSPKIQFADTGVVCYYSGIQNELVLSKAIDDLYNGRIAEHITGQELTSLTSSVLYKLNFWTRERSDAQAEVDFVFKHNGLIIPIEVKSGVTGKLRSLFQFIDRSPHPFAVRVYSGKLKLENGRTPNGKKFTLLNLPFYLINKLPEYLNREMRE